MHDKTKRIQNGCFVLFFFKYKPVSLKKTTKQTDFLKIRRVGFEKMSFSQ